MRNKTESKTLAPIFIVGCPRSGTTLLSELIAGSPWGTPFETHFIVKYFNKLEGNLDLTERSRFVSVLKSILRERPIMQHGIDMDPNVFYDSLDQHDYGHVVDQLIRRHTAKQGFDSWGDKTPHYVLNIAELHRLFPAAKFLHIVRDGRDVSVSLLKKNWGPNNVLECANHWKESYEQKTTVELLQKQGLLKHLSYESLLTSPETQIVSIFKFLNLPVSSNRLQEKVKHIRLNNSNKWQKSMSPRQIAIFESVAGSTLEHFGYKTTHIEGSLSSLVKTGAWIDAKLKRCWFLFNANVVDEVLIRLGKKSPFGDPN